ncbi:hypothetical protein GCM10022214_54490 [Actinomadura miaoliensis]|uniref:Uncharacterized protein n=1 Tax=Actinomadura miaoliensis TaxID=430685 RepID=A0ABP7WEM3_9ACTN
MRDAVSLDEIKWGGLGCWQILHRREHAMSRAAAPTPGRGRVPGGYVEPLRVHPPRTGMRPGTAAGDPQTPF